MTTYVPVWCKSNGSFLEGASHPEELVDECARLGLPALALTDRDGVYGAVRAHLQARQAGVHLIVGSEVTVDDGSTIVLLAQDRAGYGNLCRLVTAGRLRCPKGESRVSWQEVAGHASGLLALWGGARAALCAPVEPRATADLLRDAFGDRLYAMVARHRLAEEPEREARLRERARRWRLPVVAAHEVLYHSRARRALHDVMTCVRHGVSLQTAGRRIRANAEHALHSPHAFATLFADDPAAVARTREIAERCTFRFDEIRYRYPSERLPDGRSTMQHLRELVRAGAAERWGDDVPANVRAQLERELALIEELDYPGYFLTMWEIVRFCRERGILCQGRGSAANSAVCYALGITAIDPVRMNLLFERFLSRERAEPPDIDLDIAHQRREEVIRHVYDKYGRDHAAMVANVVRYRPRSAVRDVGRALGLPATAIDRLARALPHHGDVTAAHLEQAGLDPERPACVHLLELSNELLDFPRHLSIHPGGFLLGHDPVSTLVPIENATMEGRTVVQWDKDDIEALGLFKVDLLGLGALTHIDACLRMIGQAHGRRLTMATIPADDEPTFEMIRRADTVGVFQIESRAQMAMLPRLRPERFYDLVIEISIVRPGPISGGMVHPYLRRRRGEEPVVYPHESLRPVLEKTCGVPLFQEQVMKLAVIAADYTPGEADQLRRDMAAWRRTGRIEQHRERLIGRMVAKGIEREFAERVFEQIRGFGEYGFPESHAASFALIAWATAWLKRHYPAIFACALLNAQPMGFYSPATVIEDAKRHGVVVRPVDVNASAWDCTLERLDAWPEGIPDGWRTDDHRNALRIGLRYVKGFREALWPRIERARRERPFVDQHDFVRRTGLPRPMVERLAEAGAFDGLGASRREALWAAPALVARAAHPLPLEDAAPPPRFDPLDMVETVRWDYETTGHSTRAHPVETLREALSAAGLPDAATVRAMPPGRRVRYAGAVICRQRPGTARGVTFLTMEDETGFVNVIVWARTWERYARLVRTHAFLGVTGKLESEQDVCHVIAERFWIPKLDRHLPRPASRDFH
ncbi:MAG: error-prone DNA polymerase [Acidobacteriota bacterium]